MNTTTLKNVFTQSEDELKAALRGKNLPKDYEEIQRIINDHLAKLISGDSKFRDSITSSEAQYLNYILRMLLSFQKLNNAGTTDLKDLSITYEYEMPQPTENKDNAILDNTITLLPAVISSFINPWLALTLGAATVVARGVQSSRRKYRLADRLQPKKKKVDISKPITEQTLDEICTAIDNICTQIDNVVDKIRADRKDITEKYQNILRDKTLDKMYPQILSGMQYLYMENKNKEGKSEGIKTMLFHFGSYGYQFLEYTPDKVGFFTQNIKTGIDKPEMYLPAIVKIGENDEQELVTSGILFVPQNKD